MKRILSIFTILLCLCLPVTTTAIYCPPPGDPGGDWIFPGGFCDNILLVCPTSEYTSITEAMDAAEAWDTILVAEGTYSEAVTFTGDNITLRAFGSAENTIITQGADTTVSFSTKSGCTVDGFTISLSAAETTNDEVIFSNNDSAADEYNTVKNCIIDVKNKAGSVFGLYGINIDDGNFTLLNNRISINQTEDSAVYAIWNSAAHTFECIDNTIFVDQDATGAFMTVAVAHAAGASSILSCSRNTITMDSEHTGASIGHLVYAHAALNYVKENVIDAIGAAGEMYGLFTGAGDTAYYISNYIKVTTTDADGEWANFSTGTSYAHGNVVTGDGVMGTGGTIYEGVNQIEAKISINGIPYTFPTDDGDAGEQLQTDGAGVLTWEPDVGGIGADEKFTMGATVQETGNADATPDVSNAATGVNNIYESNANGTITDFDDTDDHSEFSDGDFFVFAVTDASTVIDFSENANIEGNAGVDFTGSATQIVYILFVYESARWNAVNLTGGYSTPTTLALSSINMGSGTLEGPNDESADKALGNLGEFHFRGDEDSFNAHWGTGGEIAGEASLSGVQMFTMPIDFTYVYDRDANHRIHLFEVNSKVYPNGITIDYIRVTYTKDPTTELTANLQRADDIIGVANAATIDAIGTTSGSFIEDTDANINGDAVVAAGQDIYIEIGADPVDEDVLANVTILFHAEAD